MIFKSCLLAYLSIIQSIHVKLVEKAEPDELVRPEETAIAKAEATRLKILIATQGNAAFIDQESC
jgi:hypothetical protein